MQRSGSVVVFLFLAATFGCGTNTATTDGRDAGSGGRAAATGGATEGAGGRGMGGTSSSGGSTAGSGGAATGGFSGTGGVAGAGGSTGSGGARATGGATGTGGSAGRGGAGGAEVVPCPSAAPQPGGSCPAGRVCYYEDCGGAGRTVATCVSGSSAMPRWNVTTAPCATTQCAYPASQTCPVGQLCLIRGGGALLVECIPNTCGSGSLSCGCLQSCPSDCSVIGGATSGFSVYCNTCPQGQCA